MHLDVVGMGEFRDLNDILLWNDCAIQRVLELDESSRAAIRRSVRAKWGVGVDVPVHVAAEDHMLLDIIESNMVSYDI